MEMEDGPAPKHRKLKNADLAVTDSLLEVDWMSLPKEIWGLILCWVSTKEKVNSRLVSQSWKKNIDSLSSFQVRLNERMDKERIKQICNMRLHSVEFVSLQEPFNFQFAFPKYVKELVITTLVSSRNFSQACEIFTDVQSLRFLSTVRSDTTFDSSDKESSMKALTNLKKLKEIEVGIHSFTARVLWGCETFNVIFCNNFTVKLENLNTINLNMQLHHEEIDKFFKFLLLHRNTIKHVTTRVGCASVNSIRLPTDRHFSLRDSPWFGELKTLNFHSLHILRSHTCGKCELEEVWNEVLLNQDSLTRLTADYHDLPVSDAFKIFRKNQFLRSCKLYRVSCAFLMGVDGLVLNDTYKYLQELSLDFVNSFVIYCSNTSATQCNIEFFDFENLPASLRKLSLRGYNLPKCQFVKALSGFRNVEELNIGDCVFREEATRVSLFKEIFEILELEECGVRRLIFDGFKFSAPYAEERQKWETIVELGMELNIVNIFEDSECNSISELGSVSYDFRFTKEKLRQFLNRINTSTKKVSLIT